RAVACHRPVGGIARGDQTCAGNLRLLLEITNDAGGARRRQLPARREGLRQPAADRRRVQVAADLDDLAIDLRQDLAKTLQAGLTTLVEVRLSQVEEHSVTHVDDRLRIHHAHLRFALLDLSLERLAEQLPYPRDLGGHGLLRSGLLREL